MATLNPKLTIASTGALSDTISFNVSKALTITDPGEMSRITVLHTAPTELAAASTGAHYVYIKNISSFEFVSKYSLITSRANSIIKDNILLLGNSSQLLHPVGAQGFNLALRNLETLLNCIQVDSDFSNVSDLINSDRKSAFSNVDYATNIFASDMLLSKIITFTTYNLVKSSPVLKTKFLEKILGLEGYPYLSIGTK